jgi:hypothetical protein
MTKDILKEFDVTTIHPFKDQAYQKQGDLVVYNVAPNWPYAFHVLTNYGIFIFTFETDLTSRIDGLTNQSSALEPLSVRLIDRYFNSFNKELASNDFGYACLALYNTSRTTYDIYLAGISFNGN